MLKFLDAQVGGVLGVLGRLDVVERRLEFAAQVRHLLLFVAVELVDASLMGLVGLDNSILELRLLLLPSTLDTLRSRLDVGLELGANLR